MTDSSDQYRSKLEDFWSRRETALAHIRSFEVNGCRCRLESNHAGALQAADLLIPQYSRAPLLNPERELVVRLIFSDSIQAEEPLPELMQLIRYTAASDWFHMDLAGLGHCAGDLKIGSASAVLAPVLADRPEAVARSLMNTLLTNYFFRNGFGMLHATALVRNGRLLILMAPP